MPLTAGTRVGPYEVITLLGEGGMGQVYRARDTKLGRDVALKVLPALVANDPDRLARFRREAQVLASLNDPHIAQIYGFEDAGGTHALVMELVDGPTLAERIALGPLSVTDTLPIARQIAAALEAAHEQGIVHRDLKPANVKVREDGTVKVLDFGLAKALAPAGESGVDAASSPTITTPAMTELGMILGTAAYMSPEQARGRPVDKRADIWAFGVVLFEMLTRRRLFDGETVSDTLAAVLRQEIDWRALPADTPSPVRRVLARCLERDPKQRLRDIGDAAIDLLVTAEPSATAPPAIPARTATGRVWRVLPWMAAAALLVALAWTLTRGRAAGSVATLELAIPPPAGADFLIGVNSGSAIVSPDGTTVAFVAPDHGVSRLWVRSLARDDAHPLSGTDGAYYPFWAPDSRRIAFFAGERLSVATLGAGLPAVVAPAALGRGGTWTDRGVIIFAPNPGGGLVTVPASGGTVTPLTTLDAARGENAHYWPVALPGGRDFLYFVRSAQPENDGIYLGHLDGRPASRLVSSLSSGIYAPPRRRGDPGDVLWAQDGQLLAQPLDIESGSLVGTPSPIATGVAVDAAQLGLYASVSRTGVLVWVSAHAFDLEMTLVDREGHPLKTLSFPSEAGGVIGQPTFSPDGSKILFTRFDRGSSNIWLHDVASGTTSRVTSDTGFDEMPRWSPDGRSVAYERETPDLSIVVRRLDGSVAPLVIPITGGTAAFAFTLDGTSIIVAGHEGDGLDLHAIPLAAAPPAPVAVTRASFLPLLSISPDGRWIAFTSVANNAPRITVARLVQGAAGPALGAQRAVVAVNGVGSHWRRDGHEIVYESGDAVAAVPVATSGEAITIGAPTRLFATASNRFADWAASPDHSRFVVVTAPNAVHQPLRVLTEWDARIGAAAERAAP
jgi:Tol biopolymer transport system component